MRKVFAPGARLPVIAAIVVVAAGLIGILHGSRSDAAAQPGPTLQQWQFSTLVRSAQDRVSDGNPVTLVSARKHRDRAVCRLLPASRAVHDWLGTLHSVSTTDQRGDITVALEDGVVLHTAPGALLRPGTPAFEKVADLHDGDLVRFSGSFVKPGDGTCLKATNVFARTGVTSPDFLFRFRSVAAAK